MEREENDDIDDTDGPSEREKEQYVVLTTLSGAVASWRQNMYLLASYYALTKKKAKRINRDLARDQYIQTLTSGREAECLSQLRMKTHTFHSLCDTLREKGLLRDTRDVHVEEAVAEFMHTISHSVRNRTNSVRFSRSGETISRHFQAVLHAVNQLAPEMLTQAGSHTLPGPYGFEGCVGALDGTHVPVHVPLQNHGAFRNRKGFLSQNILGACGFDMNFQYVLSGWEGSATDARVLHSALICNDPLIIPQGRYYLVDAGYANAPGFLAPYRAVRYHLSEFRGINPQNERELYNKRHSQARNVIERTFGVLKNRFGILKTATQYHYKDQVSIVVACCVMHNYIRKNNGCEGDEDDFSLDNEEVANLDGLECTDECIDTNEACNFGTPQPLPLYTQRQRDEWHSFRDNIAKRLWNDYCVHRTM